MPIPSERGGLRLFLDIPPRWRKKSQRTILAMMLRHPNASFTDIATMIFARGVDTVIDEAGRHQRRRSEDFRAGERGG